MDKTKIGLDVEEPKKACNDRDCPFHGTLKVHGKTQEATVLRAKMAKTATVEWTTYQFVPKYERYERKRTRLKVHNPLCINALEGDKVTIIETRPLSKTKHFVIIKVKK